MTVLAAWMSKRRTVLLMSDPTVNLRQKQRFLLFDSAKDSNPILEREFEDIVKINSDHRDAVLLHSSAKNQLHICWLNGTYRKVKLPARSHPSAFLLTGKLLFVGTAAGEVLSKDLTQPDAEWMTVLHRHREGVSYLSPLPDGKRVLATYDSFQMVFPLAQSSGAVKWDFNSAQILKELGIEGYDLLIDSSPPALSADGTHALQVVVPQSEPNALRPMIVHTHIPSGTVSLFSRPNLTIGYLDSDGPQIFQSAGRPMALYFGWKSQRSPSLVIQSLNGDRAPEIYFLDGIDHMDPIDLAVSAVSPDGRYIAVPTTSSEVTVLDRKLQKVSPIRFAPNNGERVIVKMQFFGERLRLVDRSGEVYEFPLIPTP